MPRRCTQQRRVGGERILGLGDAHRQVAVPFGRQLAEPGTNFAIGGDFRCAVDRRGDGFDLFPQGSVIGVDEGMVSSVRRSLVGITNVHDNGGEVSGPESTIGPVACEDDWHVHRFDVRAKEIDFRIGVAEELVDGHHSRDAEVIPHVGDVPLQIDQARLQRVQVLRGEVISRGAPVMLECSHRRDDHRRGGTQSRTTTRDVDELLRTEVGTKSGFGHDIVGEP